MTQLATTGQRPLADRITDTLEAKLPSFLAVAPPTLGEHGVKRLIRQASIAVARSDKLGACTKSSVAMSVLQAVEMGVDLASALPEAWLIPYYNGKTKETECKLMLGYKGLANIAYREGAVKAIQARVVYDEDQFDLDYGNMAKPLSHKPALSADGPRGQIIGAYAVAATADSPWPAVEFIDIEEIEVIRKASKDPNSDAWKNWYGEMSKKCAVRRLVKLLPKCPARLDRALTIDRETDGLTDTTRNGGGLSKPPSDEIEDLPQREDGPVLDQGDAQPPAEPPPAPATPPKRPTRQKPATPNYQPMPGGVEITESDIPFDLAPAAH